MSTALAALIRARSAIGRGCRYGLGHGGFNPKSLHPWDNEMRCDCSGFISWVLQVSRHTDHPWYREQNGGWLETSAIYRDAKSPFGFFTEVPLDQAEIGDVIVYGDRIVDGHRKQGHVGMISQTGKDVVMLAIHCSKGNENRTGDAIQETPAGFWFAAGGIVARFSGEG